MTETTPPAPSTAGPAGQALVRGHLAGAAASAAFALAWLGLSWWHPALTYHFGPPRPGRCCSGPGCASVPGAGMRWPRCPAGSS
jgi:hypothetical protein